MNFRSTFFSFTLLFIIHSGIAQSEFPQNYEGTWTGTMYVYTNGELENQIPMQLSIAAHQDRIWTWRIAYQSAENPSEKLYLLIAKSSEYGIYSLEEQAGGGSFEARYYAPRLYSVFEANNVLLTSTYTMTPNEIVLEITAGQMANEDVHILNHPITSLQRAVLTKQQ